MSSQAPSKGRAGPLHAALAALRSGAGAPSVSTLARELRVAPATLRRIYDGEFADLEGRPLGEIDPKQRRAWGETITTLSQEVSKRSASPIDPVAAVREFGLDPEDKVIRAAITRGMFDESEAAKIADTVLANIEARGAHLLGSDVKGIVSVGILTWPPISERDTDKSFGHSFCKRLVGALNPVHWDVQYKDRSTINECLGALVAGKSGDDLTFGVYSTVSRQLHGLDFLPVPGVGIPLHALYFRPPQLKEFEINWATIGERSTFDDVGVRAYVLDEEVGELYLRGPCGYTDQDVVSLKTFDHDAIADELRNPESDRITLFVADRPTCIRVALIMRKRGQEFRGWSLDDATYPGTKFGDRNCPVYRLGMAFRADSERWASLLKTALQEELFRNDSGWTASLYADLFARSFKEFSLVPLEPILPGPIASTFAKKVHELLVKPDGPFARKDSRLDGGTRTRLHQELREIWGVSDAMCDQKCAPEEEEEAPKSKSTRR